MTELFVTTFATLFVIIDPPGCAPIFASLTRDVPPRERRMMAVRSVTIAGGILVFFALLGE
ncbi:MarC family protein, partial [Allosphingosinicella sp.]|uniref:MarC family protein n=1 Tax=Allosphingosinicella sp. TaxID=2823234 RepID=UPI002EF74B66